MSTDSGTNHKPFVLAIVGPTASGKSDMAVQLAEQFNGEIINADAFQIYLGFDIGTAKPNSMARSRVKHHLIDIMEPIKQYTVANFVKDASAVVDEMVKRHKLPILVGGSSQYIKAFIEGWQIPAVTPNPELREKLSSKLKRDGLEALLDDLKRIDPHILPLIDVRNPRRVIRALERALSGQTSSNLATMIEPKVRMLTIGLLIERAELHARTKRRLDIMLANGWVGEVRGLLDKNIPLEAPAMAAIGYRELAHYIIQGSDLEEAIDAIRVRTNKLIRHQNNWFKRTDETIRWVNYSEIKAVNKIVENEITELKKY